MSAPKPRVLVIDDDESMLAILRFNLEQEGCEVQLARRGDVALKRLPERGEGEPASAPPFELVITDVKMPGADGMAVLRAAKACHPDLPVIVLTAFGTVEHAVEALAAGAADYVTKPFRRAELKARVRQALEQAALRREVHSLQSKVGGARLLSQSPKMEEVLRIIERVAPSEVTVLVTGESGTGKELVARELHERSGRKGPFVPVNCAALPADLLESELFGHERGAFTGADRVHRGKFVRAHEGTLFLDEIGELPLALQAKILRAIEEGVVDPVGSTERLPVDVRLVAATNRDLRHDVEEGRFRADLFHRLSVIPIQLPPLREREGDVLLLARHFLKEMDEAGVTVAPALGAELSHRPWPGNVRELKNTLQRMVLLRRTNVLDLGDLADPGTATAEAPAEVAAHGSQGLLADPALHPGELVLPEQPFSLPDLERELILKALDRHAGNQSATARYLGIPRHVLLYRLSKYDSGLD